MRCVDQLAQRSVASQQRVHVIVVIGMIAVVRARSEDRIEVNRVYAQIDRVIEVLDHTYQVAPLVTMIGGRRTPGLQIAGFGQRV